MKSNRFFFTAWPELAEWIERNAKENGLEPPEFIRSLLHKVMKETQSQ